MRFEKGQWEQAKDVLFFDLEQLKDCEIKEDWESAFKKLKGNLVDLYGIGCVSCEFECEFKDGDDVMCHYNCGAVLDDHDHETTCCKCE